MRNTGNMLKKAERLVGKVFTTASLKREIERIIKGSWVYSTPTPRGMCLYAEKDDVYVALFLDRTDSQTQYLVRRASVDKIVEPESLRKTQLLK